MYRYKITIEYDGSNFSGWQKQKNNPSVQETISEAIYKFSAQKVEVCGAGRTDAGVHALGQVAHFDSLKDFSDYTVREALNFYLQNSGIAVLNVEKVPDTFNARFCAKKRSYLYRILNRRAPSPILEKRVWHVPLPLDVNQMSIAALKLIGKHDFSSFRAAECQAKSPIKTLDEINISVINQEINIYVSAKSFLHNQVRIITGTLVNVGLGKLSPEDITQILNAKNRTKAGPTAPPFGLYLYQIQY